MVKEFIVGINKLRRRNFGRNFTRNFLEGKPLLGKGARNFATSQSIGRKIIIIYTGAMVRPSGRLVGLKSEKLRGALYSFILVKISCDQSGVSKKKWRGGEVTLKFIKKYKMDHSGVLYDNGDNITNMPELEKLEASQKMNKDKTGRIFAAFTRPEEQALAKRMGK